MFKFISPVVAAVAVLLNPTFADEWVTLKNCRLEVCKFARGEIYGRIAFHIEFSRARIM